MSMRVASDYVRVKVCGLTTEASVRAVSYARVDMVGFNFWPQSKRFVLPERAAALVEGLPAEVLRVALFVDPQPDDVARVLDVLRIDYVQLHGDESPGFCRALKTPFIKAFRLKDKATVKLIPDYLDGPSHPFLVDAFDPRLPGGSGLRADVNLARAAREKGERMMLAGGLTAECVAEAVRMIHPWGVDVASGVESAPGDKDPLKVQAFVRAVRG